MTTAIDTNVVVALWDRDPTLSLAAQTALDGAFNRGSLVVSAPVFAELIAAPGRTETFVQPDCFTPVIQSAAARDAGTQAARDRILTELATQLTLRPTARASFRCGRSKL
jgi:hypothetical protein